MIISEINLGPVEPNSPHKNDTSGMNQWATVRRFVILMLC